MDKALEQLIERRFVLPLDDDAIPEDQCIVRRIGDGKDQQGFFTGTDDEGGLILVNVIDMAGPSYLADAGIVRRTKKDRIYYYTTDFNTSSSAADAMDILKNWPVYKKNAEYQKAMTEFMTSSFSPEHIVAMKKAELLSQMFVPMQEKLNIGSHKKQENPELIRRRKFKEQILGLHPGDHITYVAMIPPTTTYSPKFFSIGTKPHEATAFALRSEAFNFMPTHGGHIKAMKQKNTVVYYIDAGSSFLGKGLKTTLDTAESVAKAIRMELPDFVFIALEGRGAFGDEQSY